MKRTIEIENLDCPNCALQLERTLQKMDGVTDCEVHFATQKITLNCSDGRLNAVETAIESFEKVRIVRPNGNAFLLRIENLHCAACALDLEDEIKKIKGVATVSVDFLSQTVRFTLSDEKSLKKVLKTVGSFDKVRILNADEMPVEPSKIKAFLPIIVSAVGFLFALGFSFGKSMVFTALTWSFSLLAYAVCGYSVLISTAKNVVKGKVFDENFLMTIASIGAFALGEPLEALAVMLLYNLGETLQAMAVGKSRKSVKNLLSLQTENAVKILGDGAYETVPSKTLSVGDTVLVKTGEKVPADALLTDEFGVFDDSSLTGESVYKERKTGDEIPSGSINAGQAVTLSVLRKSEDSTAQKILDLIENSSAKKAKSEKFIAKFARIYTPVVCLCAVLVCLLAPLFDGMIQTGGWAYLRFPYWLKIALTFLVVSCPCALVISVPLSYFRGIGASAKAGVLVKGATYLDAFASANAFVFDKTGTLTEGNFRIVAVHENGMEKPQLLSYVALLERFSTHPIAKAFDGIDVNGKTAEKVTVVQGLGVEGKVDGKTVVVGSARLLKSHGVDAPQTPEATTPVFVLVDGKFVGFIEVGDTVKPSAKPTLTALKNAKKAVYVCTGDNEIRAKKAVENLPIDNLLFGQLPKDKAEAVERLKQVHGTLVYVGDGINDAPVMQVADCAVSMGKIGSSVAVEASDLVVVGDDLTALKNGYEIAKKTTRIVKQNVTFSIVMKVAFMCLASFGILPLAIAVFADVGVMLLSVANTLRIQGKK